MTVGDILDRGVRLLVGRLPTIYAISLIVYLPLLAFQLAEPFLGLGNAALAGDMGFAGLYAGLLAETLVNLVMSMIGIVLLSTS